MNRSWMAGLSALGVLVLAGGCDEDEAGAAGSDWQGEDVHVVASGEIDGKAIDIDVTDGYCERNYIVPDMDDESTYGEGYLEKIEIKVDFEYEGNEAEFQVEFANLDYTMAEAPLRDIVVGAADSDSPNLTDINIVAALQYVEGDEEMEFEGNGEMGSFDLELLTGEVGDDGLVVPSDTGKFGGYLEVELDTGMLVVSFSVDCGENDIESEE